MSNFVFIFFAGMALAIGLNYLGIGLYKKITFKHFIFGLFALASGLYFLLISIDYFHRLVSLFFATVMFILFPWYLAFEVNFVKKRMLWTITGLGIAYYVSVLLIDFFNFPDIQRLFSYSVYALTAFFCLACLRHISKHNKQILWPFSILTGYFILFTIEEILNNSLGNTFPWRKMVNVNYLDLFPIIIIGFKLVTLIIDQTAKSKLEKEVDLYKNNSEEILNQAQRLILTLNMNGIIKFANPYFIEFFNSEEEVILKNINQFIQMDNKDALEDEVLNPKIKRGEIVTQLNTPKGMLTVAWSFVKIKSNYSTKNNNIVMLFGANITHQIEVENELRKAYANLEVLKNKLQKENIQLHSNFEQVNRSEELIGKSPDFNYILNRIEHVAKLDVPVLLEGETGVGKELVATAIHNKSNRKEKAFVKVNCAAIPFELIESELFGYEKGAFTGADRMKKGMFELADGGTLFLDEIGDLSKSVQPKLLRALQEGEIQRLGAITTVKIDARIITATNLSLEDEVKIGNFRSDLYYRINVFPITIPPLRQRKQDIPLLVDFFCNHFSKKYSKSIERISGSLMDELVSYSWPGNVRQLRNIIERAVITSSESILKLSNPLPVETKLLGSMNNNEPLSNIGTLEEFERNHIMNVLEHCNGKISGKGGASEILNLPPSTLRSKMKKLKIALS